MLIHDTIVSILYLIFQCKLSVYAWVRDPLEMDIMIYDEPAVSLVFNPIYEGKKS